MIANLEVIAKKGLVRSRVKSHHCNRIRTIKEPEIKRESGLN